MVPRPEVSVSLGSMLEMHILGPYPDLLHHKLWGWGPTAWDFISLPGNSDPCYSFRLDTLSNIYSKFWAMVPLETHYQNGDRKYMVRHLASVTPEGTFCLQFLILSSVLTHRLSAYNFQITTT